jgi:hypothetical protein
LRTLCSGLLNSTHCLWCAELTPEDLLGQTADSAASRSDKACNAARANGQGGFASADELLAEAGLGRLRFGAWDDCAWDQVGGFATGLHHGLS